jgi:excisionase family DNA binding protein
VSGVVLLDTTTLATMLGVSRRTVEGWRMRGEGPKFVRVGSRVRYDLDDVHVWIQARKVAA